MSKKIERIAISMKIPLESSKKIDELEIALTKLDQGITVTKTGVVVIAINELHEKYCGKGGKKSI